MRRNPFAVGLIGFLAVFAGPDRLPSGVQAGMIGKTHAADGAKDGSAAGRAASMPMARDPSAAVAEEYEAARRNGTREAYELFLARHGDDPLAEKARAELKRLTR
jgi:hypothetical protein